MRHAVVLLVVALSVALGACQTTRGRTPRAGDDTFAKSGELRLGSGDIIEVLGYLPQEAPLVATVGLDGMIGLPLIGSLKAAGLTTSELARAVAEAYKAYVNKPKFVVNVRELRSYRVFVTGEVKNGGEYAFLARTSLLQAAAKAGGTTEFANGQVSIYRKRQGVSELYETSMADLMQAEASGEPVYAERDDLLIVH